MTSWQILVPVRGGLSPKSRLARAVPHDEQRRILAEAFAADVVAAALASASVTAGAGRVWAVTGDPRIARALAGAGAGVLEEPAGTGLNGAVQHASRLLGEHRPGSGIAVLMGDLPGATPEAIDDALAAAEAAELGVVADQEGSGTTLLTASAGRAPRPSYGAGSFARHVAAGHTPLDVPPDSPLRRDVDTPADLLRGRASGFGPRTRAALERITVEAAG